MKYKIKEGEAHRHDDLPTPWRPLSLLAEHDLHTCRLSREWKESREGFPLLRLIGFIARRIETAIRRRVWRLARHALAVCINKKIVKTTFGNT